MNFLLTSLGRSIECSTKTIAGERVSRCMSGETLKSSMVPILFAEVVDFDEAWRKSD